MSDVERVELNDEEKAAHQAMVSAIRDGDAAQVGELIAQHPRLLDVPERNSGTALCVAVHFGQRGIAESLIEAGALVDPPCEDPLHLPIAAAVRWGQPESAEWLASLGATLERVVNDSRANATLWYRIVGQQGPDCYDMLLAAYSHADDPKKGLAEALSNANRYSRPELMARILDLASELEVSWSGEDTDALVSALYRDEACARVLLDRGVRVPNGSELPYDNGKSLWHAALNYSDDWRAPLLVEAGLDIAEWESRFGSILVTGINEDGTCCDVLRLMLEHGLDPNRPASEKTMRSSWETQNGAPMTPLYDALRKGRVDIYRLLLENGATLGHPDNLALPFFSTPGIFELSEKELRELLAQGHDIDSVSECRGSAMHGAVLTRADAESVKRLLELGARLDLLDESDRPPLHLAIDENKALAKLFVENGANPLQQDGRGQSALDYATARPGNKKLAKLMQDRLAESGVEVEISRVQLSYDEPWAAALREAMGSLGAEQQKPWQELLSLASETNSTRPSKTFLKKALEHIEAAGRDAVRAGLLRALPAYKEKIPTPPDHDEDDWHDPWSTTEMNVRALRGLLWASTHFPDDEMSAALRGVAAAAFKKIFGVGMRNAKIGNAALNALAAMDQIGLRQIVILREQTRYNPAKVNIERVLTRVSKDLEVSADELAEMAVSDFGLSECGRHVVELGEFRAELSVPGPGRTELVWYKGEKAQKTVPAAVKKDFAAELKALKVLVKDLQQATLAVRSRLEKQYLEPTCWELATWRERYLDHPVAGILARRLVWRMRVPDGAWQAVLWSESGAFIDSAGQPVAVEANTQVELWHPLHDKSDSVLAWRGRLAEEGVVQPFKQAHREVYVVTNAERTSSDHSLRFADQILMQSQLHALAEQRAWKQTRGGQWDGGNETDVYRSLPSAKLSVVYVTEPMEDFGISDYGIYLYLKGGEVRFYAEADDEERSDRLAVADVPALVFSEIMRDIDLFVSVANAANDPEWEYRNRVKDWEKRLAEELRASGETRRETLEVLIPRLKVADRLSLEGRYLIVRGDIMTYRIHLGSANVMMEDDRYLCIVKKRDLSKGIALPYEGDSKLSEILSKALLLAADEKIKDEVILEQLRRP